MGGPGGGMQMPMLMVRWESASPIREAESKLEIEMPDRSKEFYMISVSGFPTPGQQPGGRGAPNPPMANPQAKDRLKGAAVLKIKGKDPIQPSDVDVIQTDKGMMMVFFFPRESKIDLADKEITFEMNNGPMQVQTKFALKEMKYAGDLAL